MLINGNLKFHTLGDGTLQNAIMEIFTTAARDALSGGDLVAGRIIYNSTTNAYNYYNGTLWAEFGTGGDLTALQTEVNAIETASGGIFDTDGTYDAAVLDALGNVAASTSLANALSQMDTAISAAVTDSTRINDSGDTTFLDTDATAITITSGVAAGSNNAAGTPLTMSADGGSLITTSAGVSGNAGGVLSLTSGNGEGAGAGGAVTIDAGDGGATGDGGDVTVTGGTGGTGYGGSINIAAGAGQTQDYGGNVSISAGLFSGYMELTTGDSGYAGVAGGGITITAGEGQTFGNGGDIEIGSGGTVADGYSAGNIQLSAGNNGNTGDPAGNVFLRPGFNSIDGGATNAGSVSVLSSAAGAAVAPEFRLYDGHLTTDNYIGLKAPATADDTVYTLPLVPGGAGYVMTADTGGVMTWVAQSAIDPAMALNDLTNVDDTFTKTADAPAIFMGDGTNFDTVSLVAGSDLTATPASGTSLTFSVDDSYLRNNGDTLDSGALSIASGASISVLTGGDITAVDAPASPNDLTNKAYVDALVSSSATWRNPIVDVDLVDVVAANPGTMASLITAFGLSIGDNVAFIATAAITFDAGGVTVVGTTAGDIVNLSVVSGTVGDYSLIETPLTVGDRFIVAGEHGSEIGVFDSALGQIDIGGNDATVTTTNFVTGDTYRITTVGDTDFTLIGAAANTVGVSFVATGPGGGTTGDALDVTDNIKKADLVEFTGTGDGSTSASWSFPEDRSGLAAGETEIAQGITVLVSDPDSVHAGHTYMYDQTSNAWIEIAGPGAIGDGAGLSYTGSTLNVNFGAGIIELPGDEVGVDVHAAGGIRTSLTVGGAVDTTAAAQLGIIIDGSTMSVSASGLKVADAGITETQLNSSVAGLGLAGGAGTALSLDPSELVNTATVATDFLVLGDFSASEAPVKREVSSFLADHDIVNTLGGNGFAVQTTADNYVNRSIAVSGAGAEAGLAVTNGDGVSGNPTVGLDIQNLASAAADPVSTDTLAVFDGTNNESVTIAQLANAVSGNTSLGELSDVNAAVDGTSDAAGSVLVATGSDYDNKPVQYIYSSVVSGDGGSGPSLTHTATHGLGQQFVNVTVLDSTNQVIIPQSITLNALNVTVTFNSSIDCRMVIQGFAGVPVTGV